MKTLTVAEGEDVILRVNRTRSSFITWDFEKHIIAITRPGQALELEKYSYKYPGRLFSSSDASLVITKLTAQDGRIYRADLFDENCRYLCVQVYDVRIDEHGGDTPSVDSLESCSPTKQLLQCPGENVTLKLPSHPRVTNIAWDINNIDHLAIKRPGGIMYRQNFSYYGKLSAVGDGSLRLSNLSTKDQHVYRAEIFTNQWNHLCTQQYEVRVKKTHEELSKNHSLQNHIRLALSACLLLITLAILIYHCKTECSSDFRNK